MHELFSSPRLTPTRYLHLLLALFLLSSLNTIAFAAADDDRIYRLDYTVELQPAKDRARVTIEVDKGRLLRHIQFDVDPKVHTQVKANGKLTIKNDRAHWDLPEKKARLSFYVKITHERDPGEFDALMTKSWAIFRGDNIIPAVYTNELAGAESKAKLTFILPDDWSVETGWPRLRDNTFRIDNPERRFDRPVGWMIAGDLGTRRNTIGNTSIAVSAPKGSNLRRMDALVFLGFVWPEVEKAFGQSPKKLLIVGEDDPMWRGGLSASNSLFLHADRPLVSENGTSPLIHELSHMVTRISGAKDKQFNDDWIAEGLAEYYSVELLYRANGLTDKRRAQIMKRLGKWGKDVKNLRASRSHGAITGRAVVLLDELDKEIRARSDNKYNLDDVTRQLIPIRKVSLDDLRAATQDLIGPEVKTLQTSLLPVTVLSH
jgi:predicted metalloprotease with PDZ domain